MKKAVTFLLVLFMIGSLGVTAMAGELTEPPEGKVPSVEAREVKQAAPLAVPLVREANDGPSLRPNHPPIDQIPPMPMPRDTDKLPASEGLAASEGLGSGVLHNAVTGETTVVPGGETALLGGLPQGGSYNGADGGRGGSEPPPADQDHHTFTDMVKITNPGDFPWRMNAKLVMRFGSDYYVCSGTMRDAETVLTAGHCVYEYGGRGWANEIWVYPGWDGSQVGDNAENWGWGHSTDYGSWTGWTVGGDLNYDVGIIGITRAVGMLTGWYGWAYGGDCDSRKAQTYTNPSYPNQCCNPVCSLHNGRDMYYWYGQFDSCPSWNYLQVDTTGGCYNAGWGGMSGSGAYYKDGDNRYVHAFASTSDRATWTRYSRQFEDWVNWNNNVFIPSVRGSAFDLQALDVNAEPATIVQGGSTTLFNHLPTNPTDGSATGTWTFGVYLSDNDLISSADTLLSTQSYTWTFDPMTSVQVNMAKVTIPDTTPAGDYWIGVLYDPATDVNTDNNDASGWDAVPITVVLDTIPPVPVISGLIPSSTAPGSPPFDLLVNGNDFVPESVVLWDGSARETTFLSATQLKAKILAADVTTAGSASVQVFTPPPGGGTSDALVFTIAAGPVITGLSPGTIVAGSSYFILSVNGAGFIPQSVVEWNGQARKTTYVSPALVKGTINGADVASPGSRKVTVLHPGGGRSNEMTFIVIPRPPTITSLSPASAYRGDPDLDLIVNGNYFFAGSVVQWNGGGLATVYVSDKQLRATVPAAKLASSGTGKVTVFNPGDDGGSTSAAKNFDINNPPPALSGIEPASATVGDPAFFLIVTGSGFIPESVVRWSGADRTTTYESATGLTASIPASDLAIAGSAQVMVFNPTPGGGTSGAQTFTIRPPNPVPVLTAISPSSATRGDPGVTLTVSGSGFVDKLSKVRWNGVDRETSYISESQLTAVIPGSDLTNAGTVPVTVFSPAPGGGTSASQTLTINNPVPVVTAISPASVPMGGPEFHLTVTGSNFIPESRVQWKGLDRETKYLSPTELDAIILASDITVKGSAVVRVFNPGPAGGVSTTYKTITITECNPVPVVTGLSPPMVTDGGGDMYLFVNGVGFNSKSKVWWNGVQRATTYRSPTQLRVYVSAADISTPGTVPVKVVNPTPCGGSSNTADFLILARPRITALLPPSVHAGGPGLTVHLIGSGFAPGAIMRANGIDRPTNYISGSELSTAVLPAEIVNQGMVLATVANPDGGVSDSVIFTITTPFPAITGMSPAGARAGEPDITLTIDGTGFVPGSVIRWDGVDVATTYVSPTRLTAVVPVGSSAGTRGILVANPSPAGAISNTVTFAVNSATGAPPALP